jgi:hypothetical protein
MSTPLYTKGPSEVLNYGVDWSDFLDVGDTIVTSTWTVPAGITQDSENETTTVAEIFLSGGTLGNTYTLTNSITTDFGLEADREIKIWITEETLPCWPMDSGCFDAAWDAYSNEIQARAVTLAAATLRRLTGYRVGDCAIIARPSPQSSSCATMPYGSGPFVPSNFGGTWTNSIAVNRNPKDLTLPAPVARLDEVKIDGVVQDLDDFVVYNRRIVTYVGADDDFVWPATQRFDRDDDQEDTFSVTYLNSYPVDANGAYAAGLLALEFAKACDGDKKCKFPSNVSTIVRNGITVDVISGSFLDGQTGIREVDIYTAGWNTKGRTPGVFFDPGAPVHRIQTS